MRALCICYAATVNNQMIGEHTCQDGVVILNSTSVNSYIFFEVDLPDYSIGSGIHSTLRANAEATFLTIVQISARSPG